MNHPLRVTLAAEVHSRPPLQLAEFESVSHLAVYLGDNAGSGLPDSALTQHGILLALCVHFGVSGPIEGAKYFFHDFSSFRLKWECHTEFSTYTFSHLSEANLSIAEAFGKMPLQYIPQEWLTKLQGKIMVASHVILDKSTYRQASPVADIRRVFEGNLMVGSQVMQGGGEIWTDFAIQSDGFSRFVVRDTGLQDQQAGRLVQRVLEIETYRMMALLGLPHAQNASPILNAIEGELAQLTVEMTEKRDEDSVNPSQDNENEQVLLRNITGLAARIEKLSLENNYRFSASEAYFRLVRARINELREVRIEGMPTVSEFMERRLAPAMSTCESVVRRQQALAERIGYTNDLLRTRVGIVQEHQNRKILQSMNMRAAQQLRLQQAVEGLSVVAVSYYLAGLFNYVGKGLKSMGVPLNPDMLTGFLIPVIALAVWMGLRRVHKSVHKIKAKTEQR